MGKAKRLRRLRAEREASADRREPLPEAPSGSFVLGGPETESVSNSHIRGSYSNHPQSFGGMRGREIQDSTMQGNVHDPLRQAGSGSTLIAAENLNRRCYAMEIDPGYADVIISRWEAHTGRKASRPEGT